MRSKHIPWVYSDAAVVPGDHVMWLWTWWFTDTSCFFHRLELETRLQEMERRKVDEDAHHVALREKQEEQLRAAEDAKQTAEKEALVLK